MSEYIYKRIETTKTEDIHLGETLFHNANGMIGIRGAWEEGYKDNISSVRGSYINGVYDVIPMPQAESLYGLADKKQTIINLADVQDIKFYANGILISPFSVKTLKHERELNMSEGFTRRTMEVEDEEGNRIELITERFASFTNLNIFVMKTSIRCDKPILIEAKASVNADVRNFADPSDPRVAAESRQNVIVDAVSENSISAHTATSGISYVLAVKDHMTDASIKTTISDTSITNDFLGTGTDFSFTRIISFADSTRYKDPKEKAFTELHKAQLLGFEGLKELQKNYLSSFWEDCCYNIDTDGIEDVALHFNIYQLLQSVGKDGKCHLAAKGLSGEGYEGHYFWDTEMYVQPFFTLTRPEISKALLEYRYSILDKARENAKLLGHKKGALYPWRTISGEECSGFFPAGTAQYHINSAVAYAIHQYYQITEDDEFMLSMGLEMLLEIARLWMDLGSWYESTFRLCGVTGPDEYTCVVNNNYYTNVCAKHNLMWASQLIRKYKRKFAIRVTEEELKAFRNAAENMYLPYDAKLNINPQDENFLERKIWDIKNTPKDKFPLLLHYHPLTLYRYQVSKQADTILAHVLFEKDAKKKTRLNSFRYYEKITTHDSSLSSCIFSIDASRLGLKTEASSYFGDSILIDLLNTHKNTRDGIHTANMGGSILALLFGFARLTLTDNGIALSPYLPANWKGYSFSINYRGAFIQVKVYKEKLFITASTPCKIKLYGKTTYITQEPTEIEVC